MKTTTDLKRQNTREILRVIQHSSSITKNEVAEMIGISPVTAHTIIKELCEKGLCKPSGEMRYRGGRNAVSYQINESYGYIISVLLIRNSVTITVFDFSLKLVYHDQQPVDIQDVWRCIRFTGEQIEKAIRIFSNKNILGIGISMPGRSDMNGTILSIHDYPQWKHIPLGSVYRDQFHIPVIIDNDNNALLLSTRWNGLSNKHDSMAYLFVHHGVSMGFFTDGALFHGNNGYACEIGHTTIKFDGPLCHCGNRGCIQAFLSYENLCNEINQIREKQGRDTFISMEDAIEYLKNNKDPEIFQILVDATYYFAILFSHVINNFDPQAIYTRCYWLSAFPELFDRVKEQVQQLCPWLRQDNIVFYLDNNEDILLSSPACLYMEYFFKSNLFMQN